MQPLMTYCRGRESVQQVIGSWEAQCCAGQFGSFSGLMPLMETAGYRNSNDQPAPLPKLFKPMLQTSRWLAQPVQNETGTQQHRR